MSLRLSWPNRITFLRILLIPGFVLALIQSRGGPSAFRWIALGLLILVSAGDALDGYLARTLHKRSLLGAFLDPVADKLLMTAGYVVLASGFWPEPRIPLWVTAVVVSRDLLIGLFYFSIVTVAGSFRPITPSLVGKGCTMFQMLTLVAVIASPPLEALLGASGVLMLLSALFLVTLFMTLVSGIDYCYAARLSLIAPDHVAIIQTDGPEADADGPQDDTET